MTTPHMELHPLAELYPPLDPRELSLLAENIRQTGLLNPIVLLDGRILDGRNRFEACKLAGVDPKFVDYALDTDPIVWVLAQNSARRNLNSSQKACIAVDAEPFLDKLLIEAKERQRLGKQQVADPQSKGRAVDKLALYFSTNPEYVRKAKQIKDKSPQRFADIKSGAISIPAIYGQIFEPEKPSPFADTDGSWSDVRKEEEIPPLPPSLQGRRTEEFYIIRQRRDGKLNVDGGSLYDDVDVAFAFPYDKKMKSKEKIQVDCEWVRVRATYELTPVVEALKTGVVQ